MFIHLKKNINFAFSQENVAPTEQHTHLFCNLHVDTAIIVASTVASTGGH